METITKIYKDGRRATFLLTREKGFFTSHIWIYKDGKPHLHLIPSKNKGWTRCFKNCGEYGFLSAGEIGRPFEEITLNNIYLY